jgi:3-carboxy-cis,cis-muconate cycloisomerase
VNHYDRGMSAFDGLFVPAELRAAVSPRAWLEAMLDAERALVTAGASAGTTPAEIATEIAAACDAERFDFEQLVDEGRAVGNLAEPLVRALTGLVGDEAARYVHRGATSQDIVDTASMLVSRRALALVLAEADDVAAAAATLARDHRETLMVARTILQQAVPTTFGLKAAGWLTGVLDALDDLSALRFPVQVGGAAGTLSALVEIGDPARAVDCVAATVRALGLDEATPWHTTRATVTRIGDAAVRCTDAWGRIANDVLTLSRPELGEVAEAAGGGSSTMPHKANPVLSTLVRRAALAAPNLGATLHLAAAEEVDERADGSWHVEWQNLATLVRRTVVAGAQTADLLLGLRVRPTGWPPPSQPPVTTAGPNNAPWPRLPATHPTTGTSAWLGSWWTRC